ncbi:MAG: hypothetical protein R3332_02670 [Pseudohongiellaceae bacterium]|nr:hypothetical protein [Pseudohongiellaceae bacterium]
MGYLIYASLHDGKPTLEIKDADSERTCVSWCNKQSGNDEGEDRREFQRLFRELLLLSCKQKLAEH